MSRGNLSNLNKKYFEILFEINPKKVNSRISCDLMYRKFLTIPILPGFRGEHDLRSILPLFLPYNGNNVTVGICNSGNRGVREKSG